MPESLDRRELLARLPLFERLGPHEIGELLRVTTTRKLDARETLFRKGDPGDQLFVLIEGRLKAVAGGGEGKEVVFADGSRERADAIVCATGYHLRYPYLDPALVDTRDDDLTLFEGTMHPQRQDLFIVGVSRPTGAFWPIAEVHAQFAAALLSGRYALPSAAEIGLEGDKIQRDKRKNQLFDFARGTQHSNIRAAVGHQGQVLKIGL